MYKLITFYNRGTEERQIWAVYAHKAPYDNDGVGEFDNKLDAMNKAFSFGKPVINGVNKEDTPEFRALCGI